ncbi:MAG: putative metal-dependent hydrolase [Balneolaceae bacterium]|jgi:hypothetical protein
MDDIRYPLGKYQSKKDATPRDVAKWINEIEKLPAGLRESVSSLTEDQLDTPYRQGGWTVRQLIHHIADSHINSYVRFKWALTLNRPTIKAYEQDLWAQLPDSQLPVEVSLKVLDGLHERWAYLLKALNEQQLNRELVHPESGTLTVKSMIGLYAWHGKHHLAHITSLKKRKNWT